MRATRMRELNMSLGRMWTRKLALDFAFLGVVILLPRSPERAPNGTIPKTTPAVGHKIAPPLPVYRLRTPEVPPTFNLVLSLLQIARVSLRVEVPPTL